VKKLRKHTVLVLDDNLESLDGMVDYFDLIFATVYQASNAKDALELVSQNKPDFIFTDIEMPVTDGFSFISQIKDQGDNTPIVIISAYDDKEKLLKAIKLDIVDYIVKPLTSEKLQNCLKLCSNKIESSKNIVYLAEGIFWDKTTHSIVNQNSQIRLTSSENKLLEILTQRTNTSVDSKDIFYYMWDNTEKIYDPKNVRNVVYSLRKKIGQYDMIENIYGSKYMFKLKELV